MDSPSTAMLADVALLRARAARASGDPVAMSRYRDEAVRAFERMGSPLAARILADDALEVLGGRREV